MPAERKEAVRATTLLDAYNDGLGDGLVFATAIMGRAPDELVNELRADVKAKRAALRPARPSMESDDK